MTRFGPLLRNWREIRGISQQDLALASGISTRHLSFLETGRCGPSEQTVVRLGRCLELPEREIQRLVHSAGFAVQWNESVCRASSTPGQLARLGPTLTAYDPFPAFVTDPAWKIPFLNRSARALFMRLARSNPDLPRDPFDIVAILVDGKSLADVLTNKEAILRRAMSGLFRLAPDPAVVANTERLYERLSDHEQPGSPAGLADLDSDDAGAWEVVAHFEDRGHRFGLELLAIPFGGPCVGYGLLLTSPTDAQSDAEARAYFEALSRELA